MRAVMIVDGNYLFQSAKSNWDVNPKYPDCFFNIASYFEYLANQYDPQFKIHSFVNSVYLVRIRFHDSEPCESDTQSEMVLKRKKFLDKLNSNPRVDVILGRCRQIKGVYSQKGVDVNMALDIVRYAGDIDTIIVVTGDSDLVPAFNAARNREAEIILSIAPHHFSKNTVSESVQKLIQASDDYFKLTKEMLTKNRANFVQLLNQKNI